MAWTRRSPAPGRWGPRRTSPRRHARAPAQRGKSDPIDALNVARAALPEGLDAFPAAQLDGPELGLRLALFSKKCSTRIGRRLEPLTGPASDSRCRRCA